MWGTFLGFNSEMSWTDDRVRNYKVQKSRDGWRSGLSGGSRSSIWNRPPFETKYQKSFSKLNHVILLFERTSKLFFSSQNLPNMIIALISMKVNEDKMYVADYHEGGRLEVAGLMMRLLFLRNVCEAYLCKHTHVRQYVRAWPVSSWFNGQHCLLASLVVLTWGTQECTAHT